MANGQEIEEYRLDKPPIAIVHAGAFEEIEARTMAGLSQAEYDALPGTPEWITDSGPSISKSHVVAFARMKRRIEAVYYHAQAKASK
jgi:hypothetical protein